MGGRTLVVVTPGGAGRWDPHRWKARLRPALPQHRIAAWPDDRPDARDIGYAAVWLPPPGSLARFPNLRVIFNLGAGVDALLGDPLLPPVPVVRSVNPDLATRMSEYVLLHVLMHHRRQAMLDDAQHRRVWDAPDQWAAGALRVGIMGLGALGCDAALKLRSVGFDVAGWSRTRKEIPGVRSFAGADGLGPFLARTDVLVVLLPLTPQTRGILDRGLFAQLARDGVLGGPVLINAGRGGLQVEADILAALEDGTLAAATLDVFATEPLPPESPFWTHPKVTVTPHIAADSDPDVLALDVAEQILAFERGEPLRHVVDRATGY